jgi:hypothetical protein
MPFLIYKLTAALRLVHDYVPAYPAALAHAAADAVPTQVTVDLVDLRAHEALPRHGRRLGHDVMVLIGDGGNEISVPLAHVDEHGRRFGVLCDGAGRRGYVLEDRNLVLAEAPVSGFDAALIFLENGGVRRGEKWRWHTVIGHDLFLYWAFRGIGLPVEAVFPDTSDALKAFRVWSFAIGGQHQLRRPGLRIATGSDYQSGRVLQAVGNVVRLAPASAFAETETDRLIKMVRNFLRRQSVFYGETRSPALDRATGLYVHMTRIQGDIERELREQGDAVFERIAFPERVLFPLRWILQNSVRFYAEGAQQREIARDQVWRLMLGDEGVARVERELLTAETVAAITDASYCDRQGLAERLAEEIIARHYPAIMAFYAACIRGFMLAHRVAPEHFEWLLEGLTSSRNAIVEQPEKVDPTAVWDGPEFDIDIARGQVVRLRDVP